MSTNREALALPPKEVWSTQLAACPQRNRAARLEPVSNEVLRITVDQKLPWFMIPPVTWLITLKPRRTYELDRLGKEVWDLCDGNRTVGAIVDHLMQRLSLSFHETRVLTGTYLQQLVQRGVIVLVVPEGED